MGGIASGEGQEAEPIAGQRAGRTKAQQYHPRRSNGVVVVAAERLASI